MEWNPSKILFHSNKLRTILEYNSCVVPRMAEIWFTNKCNLNCNFCNETKLRKEINCDISDEIVSHICSTYSNKIKGIVIEGGGEPTCHPNFEDLCERLLKFFKVGLITNGVNRISNNILSKLSFIRISLDSYNKQSYNEIKGKDYFDIVIENIQQIKKDNPDIILGISFIVQSDLIRIHDSKKQELVSQQLNGFMNKIKCCNYIQFKPLEGDYNLSNYVIKEFEDTYKSLVSKYIQCYFIKCKEKNGGYPCIVNQLSTTILNNGDILFCKRLKNILNDDCIIGNIMDFQPYSYSKKKKELIKRFRNEKECEICPTCRLQKYNEFIFENIDILKTRYFL